MASVTIFAIISYIVMPEEAWLPSNRISHFIDSKGITETVEEIDVGRRPLTSPSPPSGDALEGNRSAGGNENVDASGSAAAPAGGAEDESGERRRMGADVRAGGDEE